MAKSLEKVLHRKIKPVVDEVMHKFLGITIEELSQDLTDKIEHRPLLNFDINTNLSFKAAKKIFKKQFITRMIETHYGNISEVARITALDRRSIHRAIHQLNIDILGSRRKMLKPSYYSKEQVDSILKNTFHTYSKFIHPEKLEQIYSQVDNLSDDILRELPPRELTMAQALEEFELDYLKQALTQNLNNVSKTAKKIQLRYETLIRKIRKYGIKL